MGTAWGSCASICHPGSGFSIYHRHGAAVPAVYVQTTTLKTYRGAYMEKGKERKERKEAKRA
jgi:hypothetical protein